MDVVGYNDSRGHLHKSLLCVISEQSERGHSGGRGVAAIMDENCSRELSASWMSPFENETIGSQMEKAGKTGAALATGVSAVELTTGRTQKSTFHTMKMWESTTPHTLSLTLNFLAFDNPETEVLAPLVRLEEWTSPEVNGVLPMDMSADSVQDAAGRMPPFLSVSIGRMVIMSDLVITSVSIPIGGPKNKDGLLLSASVNVTLERTKTSNATEIAGTFGG